MSIYFLLYTGLNVACDPLLCSNYPINYDANDGNGTKKKTTNNGNNLNKDKEIKDDGKDNTKIIIIIVCSVALFSIAAVIGIVVYKCRYKNYILLKSSLIIHEQNTKEIKIVACGLSQNFCFDFLSEYNHLH